jgi:putative transposase
MSRQPSPLVAQRNEYLLEHIRALKAEHPCWGYRRIWAYLHFVEQFAMHKKRSLRLHLLVMPNRRLKAQRTPTGRQPKPTKSTEWWGREMTKVMGEGVGWSYIVVGLDWYTKTIVGHYAGLRCTAQHWLLALDMAVNRQFPDGAREQTRSLMSDNGCQPTSTGLRRACGTLGLQQALTSDNNPKGNADTARVRRTLKDECRWLKDWTCPSELIQALEAWIADDNEHYLHSALGYKPPRQYERDYYASHSTPFVAA